MTPKKEPTIKEQVIQILLDRGPLKVPDMMPWIKGAQAHSVHSKCLEMEKMELMSHDDSMVWTLKPSVTPQTLATGQLDDGTHKEGEKVTTEEEKGKSPPPPGGSAPLKAETQFSDLLLGVGVEKVYIATITKLFFDGDIDKLDWLREVLTRHSAGFVKPNQVRLIFASWSKARGLPYNPDEFPVNESGAPGGAKGAAPEEPKKGAAKLMEDAGIGWKVAKDQAGDWVAIPGGTLSQTEATEAAERRATIAAMGLGAPVAGAEESAGGGEGKPAARGTRQGLSFQEKLMDKMLDKLFDDKLGRSDGDNPQITALSQQLQQATATIQELKGNQEREWRERVEANIAAIASRNPWEDPQGIEAMRQRLGISNSAVTDQSPAVQVLKDSADKLDKNVGRMVGIVERMILQPDLFRPEETRTPAEKEQKAGAILAVAQKSARSSELRKRAFEM